MSMDDNAEHAKVPSPVTDTPAASLSQLKQVQHTISNDVPEDIGSNLLSVLRNSLNPDEAKCRLVHHCFLFLPR